MEERKKLLRSNVFTLLFTVAAIYFASYAWFSRVQTPEFDNLEISTEAINEIQISLDNGETWLMEATLDISENYAFHTEITSNGIDFFRPIQKQSSGEPLAFAEARRGTDYLEVEVLFRALLDTYVYLDSQSYVIPKVGTEENVLLGTEVVRKSSFGNFTRDLVAGAVRVAFVEGEYVNDECIMEEETNLVWAPNKEYELIQDGNDFTVDINSDNEQNYNYLEVTAPEVFAEARVENLKDNINASDVTGFAYGDPSLLFIEGNSNIEEAEITCLKIRVWVEGNDREAKSPLRGGLFSIRLHFLGLYKDLNSETPNVSANVGEGTINNFSTVYMEHSKDYGNNWSNENEGFVVGDEVWVRFKETTTTFASDHVVLNF